MILRPYQNQTVLDIRAAWADGAQNVCSVLPTGSGKTVVFGHELMEEPGVSFAIAHRQELIAQMSMALARYGVPHRVQANESMIKWIITLHMRALGRHFYDPHAGCIVVGVRTLINRAEALKNEIKAARLWVIDECFPAGTMVGSTPIESIKTGDVVESFNEYGWNVEKQTVTHVFKNPAPDFMCCVCIEGKAPEYGTQGHPYYTRRGWVQAGKLTTIDEVLCYGKMHDVSESGIIGRILEKATSIKNRAGVLLQQMRERIQTAGFFGDHGQNKSKICLHADEEKQPDAEKRDEKKDVRHPSTDRACTESTGRKRSAPIESRTKTLRGTLASWFCNAIGDKDGPLSRWVRVPTLLQSRLRAFRHENCYRGGRRKSRPVVETGARQEKRRVLKWQRVESVTVQKRENFENTQGYCGDGYVYNIEVSKTNTYMANGVVVHNCHHIVRKNEWGKAVALFSDNCRGLGVTATATRSDGKGLGRHADGVMDSLVVGPSGREMITAGYLSDYRLFAPLTDLHLDQVPIGSTGDYSKPKLTAEVRKSTITGDVVEQYLKIAPGKLGVTFVTDVETAGEVSARYNACGIPAQVIHAKTADRVRQAAVDSLARGDLKQLVNVDIFGEGFDLPALEVCSMARPTQSFGLYVQQFGRALRPMEGKDYAIIIDHVGNIERHAARGLPDKPQIWTLDARERRVAGVKNPDEVPIKTCTKCTAVYEGFRRECPFCGHVNTPDARASVEQVEGDLYELDPAVLADMRGEIERIDATTQSVGDKLRFAGAPDIAIMGAMKAHRLRKEAQTNLRHTIALWAGAQREAGVPDYISYKQFYRKFGVDVVGAQALGKKRAIDLTAKILGG